MILKIHTGEAIAITVLLNTTMIYLWRMFARNTNLQKKTSQAQTKVAQVEIIFLKNAA